MNREQANIVRLVLMCVAWVIGLFVSGGMDPLLRLAVPALFAAGIYVLTQDLGYAYRRGGTPKYWRGRRIDDEDDKRRWN